MNKIGFDNEKYLSMQSEHIRERVDKFGGKLYLEFGGKLFDDFHASRVLPGFKPDSKLQMLLKMKEEAEHQDWCIHIPGRHRTTVRSQLVLDFSRKEVRDYIYEQMKAILSSANIEYVKWDMNRQLSEVGNEVFPPERQREIWHRYVLGVYEMQERLLTDFPDLLLENCAGGG